MRILLLSTSMGMGGADQQLLNAALGLRERGHEVRIISLTPLGEMGARARAQPAETPEAARTEARTKRRASRSAQNTKAVQRAHGLSKWAWMGVRARAQFAEMPEAAELMRERSGNARAERESRSAHLLRIAKQKARPARSPYAARTRSAASEGACLRRSRVGAVPNASR